jgi:hypothetical protein
VYLRKLRYAFENTSMNLNISQDKIDNDKNNNHRRCILEMFKLNYVFGIGYKMKSRKEWVKANAVQRIEN